MKKKYRFLILVLTFLITTNCLVYRPKAIPLVAPAPTLVTAYETIVSLAPALGPIGFCAVALIGAGVVFHNREEIMAVSYSAYQKVKGAIIQTADGAYAVTQEFINSINKYISEQKDKKILTIECDKGVSIQFNDSMLGNVYVFQPKVGDILANEKITTLTACTWTVKVEKSKYNYGTSYGIGGSVYVDFYKNGLEKWFFVPDGISFKPVTTGSICADINKDTFTDTKDNSISVGQSVTIPNNLVNGEDLVGVTVGTIPNVNVKVNPIDKPIDPPIDKPIDPPVVKPTTWEWLKDLLGKILDAIKSIPSLLQDILDWLLSIPKWFLVDWDLVFTHANYGSIVETKLEPFYQTVNLLQDIKANPKSHNGKFYMKIPKEMGGDGSEQCVLDLSYGDVYFKLARNILKAGMWVAFLFWIIKLFKPKFTIGG